MLATNDGVSPIFENHTIGIGSLVLRKMVYTKGGLRRNGQSIVVPISPETQKTGTGLGYSGATSSFADTRKVLFVAGGIHTEEKPVDECVVRLIVSYVP